MKTMLLNTDILSCPICNDVIATSYDHVSSQSQAFALALSHAAVECCQTFHAWRREGGGEEGQPSQVALCMGGISGAKIWDFGICIAVY